MRVELIQYTGLASDRVIEQSDTEAYDEHNKLVFMCQTNLETALSKLTLYVKPSYEMVLALILGVCRYISSRVFLYANIKL